MPDPTGPPDTPGTGAPGSPEATLSATRAVLYEAVDGYVRDRRREGDPAERVVVHLKGVVQDALDASVAWDTQRALREEVVHWAIECYYRPA